MIALFRSLFAPPRHLILLLAAVWLGLSLSEKQAERHSVSKEALNNIVYYSILGYVIGGRVLFALENFSIFARSPLSVFSPNIDLFDPIAALITAFLIGVIYGQRQSMPLWSTLDALTPFFAVIAIGLSLSHLAAGTAFGRPTDLPWGMELWNATRHPFQVYELIASLLIFAFIWLQTIKRTGSLFLLFTALTSGSRLFLEAFRGDSTLVFGGIREAQLLAWAFLAAAIVTYEWINKEKEVS